MAIGLFASGKFGIPDPAGTADASATIPKVEGLLYGGGASQLVAQVLGSLTCIVVVSLAAAALMYAIRAIPGSWNLRLSRDDELEGIDIVEHGLPAYHMEFGHGFSYTTMPGSGGSSGSIPLDEDLEPTAPETADA